MLEIINEFRRSNFIKDAIVDAEMCHFCTLHNYAMASANKLFHADRHYREGWSEAIACYPFIKTWDDTLRRITWDVIGKSLNGHREIVLNSQTIACSAIESNGTVLVTIRGR